jgi:hypothetical protein
LVLTLVVAGCQNDHGVTVTVHTNSAAVTKVRLYVGVGDSSTTDLTDDSMVTIRDAQYWTRDPGNSIDLQDVSHGEVTFNYDTSDPIPVVIAIGYDNQGQPVAAAVADTLTPSTTRNDFQIYDLTLVAADPFSQTSSPMQVGLWSPASTTDLLHASCAGIIDGTKDHPYFVVLDHDQDCDGFIDGTDQECTPDYFQGTLSADPSTADCLVATPPSSGLGGSCQLGGSPCTDNTPVTMTSCQPSTTCLPTSLCAADVCPATHPGDFDCAADLVAAGVLVSGHAHYDCVVPADATGKVCSNTVLSLDRPPTGGYDCTEFQIGDSMTPLGNQIKQGNVSFMAKDLTANVSCAASISVGGTPQNITQALSGFVDFTLKNTGGVAIPIVFTFDKQLGCAVATGHCTLDARAFDASQTRCAAGWMPATAVDVGTSTGTDVSDPTLTDDQKTMFYVLNGDIVMSTKTGNVWGTPVSLGLATTGNQSPEVGGLGTANGTTLLYTAQMGMNRSIFIMTRAAVDLPFDVAVPLTDGGQTASFTAATFAPDNPHDASGIRHLIAAGSIGIGAQSLFDVVYSDAMVIISTVVIDIANGPTNPDKPHLSPDGLQLYFEGTNPGGHVTLWVASRTTIDDPFTYAVELAELASPDPMSYTGGAWVGPSGRAMYFTQHTGNNVDAIYLTTRANL